MPPNTTKYDMSDTVYHTSNFNTIHYNLDDTLILQKKVYNVINNDSLSLYYTMRNVDTIFFLCLSNLNL